MGNRFTDSNICECLSIRILGVCGQMLKIFLVRCFAGSLGCLAGSRAELKEMFGVGVELDIGQLFEPGVLQYVFPKCFQFEKNDHKSRTGRIVGIRSFSLQLHFHRFHLGHAKYKLNLVNTR